MRSTFGEIVFATVVSFVAAVLAAIAGWIGVIAICSKLLDGEAGKWSVLALAPALGLLLAAAVFILVFRKIITYGEGPSQSS